ncbi:hypothetical protein [Streptomyces sp. NPDC059916]|uniref:hypothetical protein n=1 Tax=Streptomyces sp. NPDC059916 TaxID=3347001 RepID=UPI0036AD7561
MLLVHVIAPVGDEAAGDDDRAELEKCFGAEDTPAAAGDRESVGDQVPGRSLDRAAANRPALGEGLVVMEAFGVVGQVTEDFVEAVRCSLVSSF